MCVGGELCCPCTRMLDKFWRVFNDAVTFTLLWDKKCSECEMRGGADTWADTGRKEPAQRAPAVPCPSGCPCPRQNNAAAWLTTLCLHRFCRPKRKSDGDPEEPGGSGQGPGPDPVSHRWAGPFLLLPRSLGEPTAWVGGRRSGRETPVPSSEPYSCLCRRRCPRELHGKGQGRARAPLASTGASWMNWKVHTSRGNAKPKVVPDSLGISAASN